MSWVEALVNGDIGEVVKWAVLALVGLVMLVILGLVFAFYPILVYTAAAIIVAAVLKLVDVDTKYAIAVFVLIFGVGVLTTVA